MGGVRVYVNEKTKKKNGEVAVYAMVYMAGKSIKINTGVVVPLENFQNGIVKGNNKDAKDKNLIIENCLSRINEIQVRYRLQNKKLTPDLLTREYKNPTYYIDFYKWFDEKLKERKKNKEISIQAERCQRVVLNKLKKYRAKLCFAEIDSKFLSSFRNYCRTSLKNDVNTISKNLDYFNAYMSIAKREELITVNPFDNFNYSEVEPARVYLNETEFRSLVELYDKRELEVHLQRTLRHFLFMCFTGLRISDLMRIKKDNIQENALKFVPHKTRSKKRIEIHVPLLTRAKKLIQDEGNRAGLLFDCITEQKMNEQLKTIAGKAKIKKAITNHSARHTFATIFINKTKDVATLQRLLGHSNIRETMMYVHIDTKEINEQMSNFDKMLF